jgi:ATP-dependent Clp protease ATP-binding subunit ClpA
LELLNEALVEVVEVHSRVLARPSALSLGSPESSLWIQMSMPPKLTRFDSAAQALLEMAQGETEARGLPYIDSVSLLLAFLDSPETSTCMILAAAGVNRDALLAAVSECLGQRPLIVGDQPLTAVKDAISRAIDAAGSRGDAPATIDDLSVSLLTGEGGLAIEALRELGLDVTDLARAIEASNLKGG